MVVASTRRTGRLSAVLLTLGLHAALLALLVYSFRHFTAPEKPVRESYLRLPRLIEPKAAPRTIDARGKSRPAPPLFVPPAPPGAPSAAGPPDITALGQDLNGCAPEKYADLSPERRAHCTRPGEGLARAEAPDLMGTRSHVKDEAYWEEEWAREQSPVLLPCLGGLDVICLLEKIATGKIGDFTDPHKWPHYEVTQIPPEDFKKIEEAYDAWHKAHRENHLATAH